MDGALSSPSRDCPRCGASLLEAEEKECAGCWLAPAAVEAGEVIGGYRLLGAIGEGGSATVHLAMRLEKGDLFALKLARPSGEHAFMAFQNELDNARTLRGSGARVVEVMDHGRSARGQAFLVMRLMEGGSLTDAVGVGQYGGLREALTLLGKLAEMLASAHARAVLHCDLKPDNILFDARGEPHLADFGVAQQMSSRGARSLTLGGTAGWMSPEQARGLTLRNGEREPEPLTVASDVFSLGVVFHWLLTRKLPFGAGADYAQRAQFESAPPCVPERAIARELERECAAIAARALQKDPCRRYRTATQFAEDVRRALAGLPLLSEEGRAGRRLALWVNRHKILALIGLTLCLLVLYLPLVPLLVLGQSREVLVEQNSNAALYQAGAVMNELRYFSDRLMRMAAEDEVRALALSPAAYVTSPQLSRFAMNDSNNLLIFSTDGVCRARWPAAVSPPRSPNFSFRDYFQGAARLGGEKRREIYVPRIIRSQTTGMLELDLSTPIFDDRGNWIGVAAAARLARSTFGAVQMSCAGGGGCMTALLGSRDRDDPGAPLSPATIYVAAPALRTGEEVALDAALSRKVCKQLGCTPAAHSQFVARPGVRPLVQDFHDPLSGRELLGAFAPVGGTGLVVLVATPASAARELTDRMLERARAYLPVPLLVGAALFTGLLLSLRLRMAKPL